MTRTLVIDPNGDNIIVPCREAGLAAPRRVGAIDYAAAGNERSFIQAELRNVPISFIQVAPATARAIRAKFALGAQVECCGDVFLNEDPDTIVVCSGDYVDKMEKAGPNRSPDLVLHEVDSTELAGDETPTGVYLTNLASDLGGGLLKAWTTLEGGSANAAGRRILNAATPTPCGSTPNPALVCGFTYTPDGSPEATWVTTPALRDGYITGAPSVSFNSIGGTGDKWSQGCMAKIELLNGAGAVLNTMLTGYGGNGGFAGGDVTMSAGAVVLQMLTGYRVRVKLYGRLALHGGYADGNDGSNLDRQTITYGYSGAGYYSTLTFAGLGALIKP